MLSDVAYPLLSGTHVARDFVEFPSQLYEHWPERPETLRRFARHYRTGEPAPRGADRSACTLRGASTKASPPSNTRPRRWSTWSCTADAIPVKSTSPPSRRASSRGDRHARGDRAAPLGRRTSSTSSPARAIRPAITAIRGLGNPRCRRLRGVRGERRRIDSAATSMPVKLTSMKNPPMIA